MGNNSSKIIEVDNLEQHLSNCQTLKTISIKSFYFRFKNIWITSFSQIRYYGILFRIIKDTTTARTIFITLFNTSLNTYCTIIYFIRRYKTKFN
jgi:hypothetical protein